MVRLFTLSLLAAALNGCFFPADRGQALEGRVDKLADQNQRLREALTETQEKLDETTARLRETVDTLDKASRTTGANIGVKLDGAIQDVAALHGQIESYQFKVNELEQRLKELEGKGATASASSKLDEPKKEEVKRPDEPKEYLKLAEDKVKGGDLELGRKLYAELMKKWPKDDATGEAHFGLGETFFTEKKCREALYEYGKVIQDFSKTRSAPTAYLRSAECFKELKMVAEAKLALEELMKQYPKSDSAKAAKQKLVELSKAPAPASSGGKKK